MGLCPFSGVALDIHEKFQLLLWVGVFHTIQGGDFFQVWVYYWEIIVSRLHSPYIPLWDILPWGQGDKNI